MNNIKIFKNDKLSFLELRYVRNINECQKLHSHEEITITALKKGLIDIVFNNFTHNLNPKEFICINSNIAHSAVVNKVSEDGYVLYIKKEFLDSYNLDFEKDYQVFDDKKETFIKFCESLFDKSISFLEIQERFLDFCLNIFEYKSIVKKDSSKAYDIKEYIDNNFLEDLSLEFLSNRFELTSIHLIRVFKKEFDLSIHSYILNKKVHMAKELLNTTKAITMIAQECGFFDQSHLNRCFKRVYQITPKEYAKNIFS